MFIYNFKKRKNLHQFLQINGPINKYVESDRQSERFPSRQSPSPDIPVDDYSSFQIKDSIPAPTRP